MGAIKYIPFLKMKSGEIMALRELNDNIIDNLSPFFDYARRDNITETSFKDTIKRLYRSIEQNCNKLNALYIDNFDLDSSFAVNGKNSYEYFISVFKDLNWIPVIGLDRTVEHNESVRYAKVEKRISSDIVALRITPDDFLNFHIVKNEIQSELSPVVNNFKEVDIVFDCRVCINNDPNLLSSNIVDFISGINSLLKVRRFIVTGSSITASISGVAEVDGETVIERNEILIYNRVVNGISINQDIILGDYGAVSPNYSDLELPGEYMRTVTAPKLIYAYDSKQYIIRGRALKTYGDHQFRPLSSRLVSKSFYRGRSYSYGDNYLYEKSQNIGNLATPSTVVKPLCNAHITFMSNTYG